MRTTQRLQVQRRLSVLAMLGGCGGSPPAPPPPPPPPFRLESAALEGGQRLTLVAREGVEIGVRLSPSLELANGEIVRFAADSISPDSAYFLTAPTAFLPGRTTAVHGVLRASICDNFERICRSIALEL
jgi:hypothetical protein